MRHYEIMVILDGSLEERTVTPSLDTYLNVIRSSGGSVEKIDVWGRRRLAFEINKKTEGIYAVIDLQATPAGGGRAGPPAATQRVGAADQGHPARRSLTDRAGRLPHSRCATSRAANPEPSHPCGNLSLVKRTMLGALGVDHGSRRRHHHGHRQPDRRP